MKKMMLLLLVVLTLGMTGVHALPYGNVENTPDVTVTLVNLDPNPAIAGETFEVRTLVENRGAAVQGVIVEVVPDYPFTLLDTSTAAQDLGDFGEHQGGDLGKVVKWNLRADRDVSAGTYYLKVKEYEVGYEEHAITYTLPIAIKTRESAEVIYIDKTVIVPGIETQMKFTINNIGNAPIRDLTFNWQNKDKVILPVGGDNTQYIRYLDQGQSTDLVYNVIADPNANPGLYSLDLNLQYLDTLNNTRAQVATTAGMYVGGGTDFDAAFSQSSSGDTSFSVSNIGSNSAYSVSVKVPAQDGWRVSGPDTVIIGNLNKGDYTVATFAIQSPFGTSGLAATGRTRRAGAGVPSGTTPPANVTGTPPSTIRLEISYTDTRGTRQVVEKDIKLSPQDITSAQATTTVVTTSFWSKYQWYMIIVVVLVIAYVGYRKWKRGKTVTKKK